MESTPLRKLSRVDFMQQLGAVWGARGAGDLVVKLTPMSCASTHDNAGAVEVEGSIPHVATWLTSLALPGNFVMRATEYVSDTCYVELSDPTLLHTNARKRRRHSNTTRHSITGFRAVVVYVCSLATHYTVLIATLSYGISEYNALVSLFVGGRPLLVNGRFFVAAAAALAPALAPAPSPSPTAAAAAAPAPIRTPSRPTLLPLTRKRCRTPPAAVSVSPAFDPTASPVFDPTASPGFDPTASPGFDPTASPAFDPTASPGFDPTASPAFDPTASPAHAPSSPTYGFTASPAYTPSAAAPAPAAVPAPAPVPAAAPAPVPAAAPAPAPAGRAPRPPSPLFSHAFGAGVPQLATAPTAPIHLRTSPTAAHMTDIYAVKRVAGMHLPDAAVHALTQRAKVYNRDADAKVFLQQLITHVINLCLAGGVKVPSVAMLMGVVTLNFRTMETRIATSASLSSTPSFTMDVELVGGGSATLSTTNAWEVFQGPGPTSRMWPTPLPTAPGGGSRRFPDNFLTKKGCVDVPSATGCSDAFLRIPKHMTQFSRLESGLYRAHTLRCVLDDVKVVVRHFAQQSTTAMTYDSARLTLYDFKLEHLLPYTAIRIDGVTLYFNLVNYTWTEIPTADPAFWSPISTKRNMAYYSSLVFPMVALESPPPLPSSASMWAVFERPAAAAPAAAAPAAAAPAAAAPAAAAPAAAAPASGALDKLLAGIATDTISGDTAFDLFRAIPAAHRDDARRAIFAMRSRHLDLETFEHGCWHSGCAKGKVDMATALCTTNASTTFDKAMAHFNPSLLSGDTLHITPLCMVVGSDGETFCARFTFRSFIIMEAFSTHYSAPFTPVPTTLMPDAFTKFPDVRWSPNAREWACRMEQPSIHAGVKAATTALGALRPPSGPRRTEYTLPVPLPTNETYFVKRRDAVCGTFKLFPALDLRVQLRLAEALRLVRGHKDTMRGMYEDLPISREPPLNDLNAMARDAACNIKVAFMSGDSISKQAADHYNTAMKATLERAGAGVKPPHPYGPMHEKQRHDMLALVAYGLTNAGLVAYCECTATVDAALGAVVVEALTSPHNNMNHTTVGVLSVVGVTSGVSQGRSAFKQAKQGIAFHGVEGVSAGTAVHTGGFASNMNIFGSHGEKYSVLGGFSRSPPKKAQESGYCGPGHYSTTNATQAAQYAGAIPHSELSTKQCDQLAKLAEKLGISAHKLRVCALRVDRVPLEGAKFQTSGPLRLRDLNTASGTRAVAVTEGARSMVSTKFACYSQTRMFVSEYVDPVAVALVVTVSKSDL